MRTYDHQPSGTIDRARLTEVQGRVIRFWNNDVGDNIDGVVEAIAAAVRS